ncbi:hypothetical protein KP003_14230 [Geomonas nitrogeniifigens]|uniref:hypothetical protein n=1 Tax=Geomonas diazotrophica TaxID=2843197 RepID=UPI001C2BA511|nr:hypothetical protein [Geomonas nitrogeniifigens]QXE85534.1 hypothetical protein KP003_14230 [Geomonas nitrogeniifigens]
MEDIDTNSREWIIASNAADQVLPSHVLVTNNSACCVDVNFKVLPSRLQIQLRLVNTGHVPPPIWIVRRKMSISTDSNGVSVDPVRWERGPEVTIEWPNVKDRFAVLAPSNVTVTNHSNDGRGAAPIGEAVVEWQLTRVVGVAEDPLNWPTVRDKVDLSAYDTGELSSLHRDLLTRTCVQISDSIKDLCRKKPGLVEHLASVGLSEALNESDLVQILKDMPDPILRAFFHSFTQSAKRDKRRKILPSLRNYLARPELEESLLAFPQMAEALRRYDLAKVKVPITPVSVIMGFENEPHIVRKWLCRQSAEELGLWLKLVAGGASVGSLAKLRMELDITITDEDPKDILEAYSEIEAVRVVDLKERFVPGCDLFKTTEIISQKIDGVSGGERTGAQILEIRCEFRRLIAAVIAEIDLVAQHRPPDPRWSKLRAISEETLGTDPVKGLTLIAEWEKEYRLSADHDCGNGQRPQLVIDQLLLADFTMRRNERARELVQAIVRLLVLCTPVSPSTQRSEGTVTGQTLIDVEDKIDRLIADCSGLQLSVVCASFPGFDIGGVRKSLMAGLKEAQTAAERSPDLAEAAAVARITGKVASSLDSISLSCSLDRLREMVLGAIDEARGDQATKGDRVEMSRQREEIRHLAGDLRANLHHVMAAVTALRELRVASIERMKPWRDIMKRCDERLLQRLGIDGRSGVDDLRDAFIAHGKEVADRLGCELEELKNEISTLRLLADDPIVLATLDELEKALRDLRPERLAGVTGVSAANDMAYPSEYRRLSGLLAMQDSLDAIRARLTAAAQALYRRLAEIRDAIAGHKVARESAVFLAHLQALYENKDLSGLVKLSERMDVLYRIWSHRVRWFGAANQEPPAKLSWLVKPTGEPDLKQMLLRAATCSSMEQLLEGDADQLREVLNLYEKLPKVVKQAYDSTPQMLTDLGVELRLRFTAFFSAVGGNPSIASAIPHQPLAHTTDTTIIINWIFGYLRHAGFPQNELGWPQKPEGYSVQDPVVEELLKYHLVPEV